MAGTLTISTLSDGTNSTSATNCIQGSAKAWVNFDGTGGATIRGSYNVSSVTYNGTGDYTINFTNALSNANYSASMTVGTFANTDGTNRSIVSRHQQTTSVRAMVYVSTNGNANDVPSVGVSVFSS
jgi:hypothetical protein